MAENEIRIKDLPSTQQINETDDVIVLDNATDGTRKLQGKVLLDMIHSAMAKGTASGAVASFTDGSDGIPMTDLVVSIEPQQSGSGDPSPTNIRPISGWTACNVARTGKNLFDVANTATIYPKLKQGQTIYAKQNSSNDFGLYVLYEGDSQSTSLQLNSNTKASMVLTKDVVQIAISDNARNALISQGKDIMVSTTDFTDIEPYNGDTYTINFVDGSNPLIVYGSTVELVKVNGEWKWKLTVARSLVTYSGLDEEGWVGQDGTYGCLIPQYFHKAQTPISNIYKGVSPRVPTDLQLGEFAQYSPTYNSINIKTNYASLSDFKTSLQSIPLTVLFEIKVPQTYYINVDDLPDSLEGVNNIWADTGNVLNVEYVRDTTTIINQILARLDALES